MKDASKKRREYVRKKAHAWSYGMLALSFTAVFFAMGLYLLYLQGMANLEAIAILLAIFGGMTIYGIGHSRAAIKESKSIPYVPPVAEQIAALPADEVLLRGSDQPVATPDELLRAAHVTSAIPTAELLRSTDGSPTIDRKRT